MQVPACWGKSVLTRAFRDRVMRWLAAFAVVAVVIFSMPVFVAAWLLGVFFWFRAFANSLGMLSKQRGGFCGKNLEVFCNPFYGWRRSDLLPEGQGNHSLMMEGIVGFLLSCAAGFAAGALAELVSSQ